MAVRATHCVVVGSSAFDRSAVVGVIRTARAAAVFAGLGGCVQLHRGLGGQAVGQSPDLGSILKSGLTESGAAKSESDLNAT